MNMNPIMLDLLNEGDKTKVKHDKTLVSRNQDYEVNRLAKKFPDEHDLDVQTLKNFIKKLPGHIRSLKKITKELEYYFL